MHLSHSILLTITAFTAPSLSQRSSPVSGKQADPPTTEGIPMRWGHLPPGSYYHPGGGLGTGDCDERLGCVEGNCWAQLCYVGDDASQPQSDPSCRYMYWGEC